MKRLRTFQGSPQDEQDAVGKVLALLKAHTPSSVVSGALQGGQLYAGRKDKETFADLSKALFDFDPYLKRSIVEAALCKWDKETDYQLSQEETNKGAWIRHQAWVVKDLIMKQIKSEHNRRRYTTPRPAGGGVAGVVQSLLQGNSNMGSTEPVGSPKPAPVCAGWEAKHRRLLRKRSSEQDDVAVVAYQKVTKETSSSTSAKEKILALYGVASNQAIETPRSPSPKVKANKNLVDLTLDDSSPDSQKEEKPKGRFKHYFDHHRCKVVCAWEDGTVEEARTEQGSEGFVVGIFEDGTAWTSEVPNVALAGPTANFFGKKKKGKKRKNQ